MLTSEETGELGTYIVKGSGEAITTYRVEPGVVTLLGLFASPQSCREIARWLAQQSGLASLDLSLFEVLVHQGILVAEPPTFCETPLTARAALAVASS